MTKGPFVDAGHAEWLLDALRIADVLVPEAMRPWVSAHNLSSPLKHTAHAREEDVDNWALSSDLSAHDNDVDN